MKKIIIILLVVIMVVVGFIVLRSKSENAGTADKVSNNSSDAGSSQEAIKVDKVTIADFAFSPAKISVKKGSTVTWTNQDSVKHNISPDNASDDFKASELLGKGESYSFTFNKVGTYTYHCTPHPTMKASVEVTE